MSRRPGKVATLSCRKRFTIPAAIPIPSVLISVTSAAEHPAQHSKRAASYRCLFCRVTIRLRRKPCQAFLSEIWQRPKMTSGLLQHDACELFAARTNHLCGKALRLACIPNCAALSPTLPCISKNREPFAVERTAFLEQTITRLFDRARREGRSPLKKSHYRK
jgi:hypothetical protein